MTLTQQEIRMSGSGYPTYSWIVKKPVLSLPFLGLFNARKEIFLFHFRSIRVTYKFESASSLARHLTLLD